MCKGLEVEEEKVRQFQRTRDIEKEGRSQT